MRPDCSGIILRNIIVLLPNAQQHTGPVPSSLFSPFPAFVTARSGKQRGLWLVYSDFFEIDEIYFKIGRALGGRRELSRITNLHFKLF